MTVQVLGCVLGGAVLQNRVSYAQMIASTATTPAIRPRTLLVILAAAVGLLNVTWGVQWA
jgi:hypothetical protein